MKKSCKGCRALDGWSCGLMYKTKRNNTGFYGDIYPLEDCPKPKTYKAYFQLMKEMRGKMKEAK